MATTKAVTATGNRHVDGLLEGRAWLGTTSFSFPDAPSDYEAIYGTGEPSSGFAQLSLATMQVARAALLGESAVTGGNAVLYGMGVAQFTNLDIVDAGFDGADIRLAQSSIPPTAYARMPGGAAGGDIWFGTAYNYRNPVLGNYAYHTILHEIGHALGLKHGHEVGGVTNAAVPSDRDSIEFTLMSYRSTTGGKTTGYTYEAWGAPQSFMMLDIAALQAMYGADYSLNGGDSVYAWDPLTGAMSIDGVAQGAPGGNRIFLTIWDGGGHDTYDFSNYDGGVAVSLAPGGWSVASAAQLATLAIGKQARGNVFNALQYQGDAASLIEDAIGGAGHDRIAGNEAANRLRGGAGNDTLSGAGGDDTLEGGGGADSLAGGMGDDLYIIGAGTRVILELSNQGYDTVHAAMSWTLIAHLEALVLTGTDAIDGTGNTLANRLTGNAAANRLTGGAGADTLLGGMGDDSYVITGVTQMTIELPDEGIDTVLATITWTLGENIENLTLLGSVGLAGTGNALANRIMGNGGANRLTGGEGVDTLDGGLGADTLDGGSGADLMQGGAGNDTYIVDEAGDQVTEPEASGIDLVISGIDWILGTTLERLRLSGTADLSGTGNALANSLWGNAGNNHLQGGDGIDTLDGGAGADTLDGGAGADSMGGGLGDDTYVVDIAKDKVIEAAKGGLDTVYASVSLTLGTNIEMLVLTGGAALSGAGNTLDNALTGNDGANVLAGLVGADTLSGGAGDDTLIGGLGADRVAGGDGADAFRFGDAKEGGDVIVDFHAADDWVELSAKGFSGGLKLGMDLSASGRLQINDAGAAVGTVAQFLFATATSQFWFDSNGTGKGGTVLLADFSGASVTAADFVLIA